MNTGAANIEEALVLTGYGKFHYILTGCCAFCLLASGVQNGLNAFFLPAAQCDLNLTSSEIGSLNAAFLIGGITSAFLWGLLADLFGRKRVLLFTLFADWVITILASLSQTYLTLFIFRYFNGFLIGAPATLTYSYYGEFHAENSRNKAVCFIGLFFNLFLLVLPAIAWIIMPLKWEFYIFGILITSWRIYIMVISLPSLISGIWLIFLPESPKFLSTRGESKEALNILKNMYSINTGESIENFKVKLLINDKNMKKVIDDTNNMKAVGRGKFLRILKDAKEQIKQLFKPPLIVYTILVSAILFCNMFGYLGLGLWIPEILNRFEEFYKNHPNETITLCELQSHTDKVTNEVTPILPSNLTEYKIGPENLVRCDNHMDTTVFINSFIMGACVVTLNIIATFFVGSFNRKVLPIITMALSTISAASIYWLNSSLQHLISGCVFQAMVGVGNIILNSVIVDIFPTSVGAMAICTSILFGRLGAVVSNLVIGFLLDVSCEIPLIIIVVTLLVGTILCFLIPTNIPESKEEEPPQEIYKSVSDIAIISSL